jgi:hypothetical protein
MASEQQAVGYFVVHIIGQGGRRCFSPSASDGLRVALKI